jgi:hypothetical protein
MSESSSSSSSIGFPGLLTILFVGLKLNHIINWSWFWVVSPIWISISLFLVFLVILLVFIAIKAASEAIN